MKISFYLTHDCIYIIQNFFVRKTQNAEAHSLQFGLPHGIIFLLLPFRMITAIDLYHQAASLRNEIYNVVTNDMLPEKTHSEIILAKTLPEEALCHRHVFSILQSKCFQYLVSIR